MPLCDIRPKKRRATIGRPGDDTHAAPMPGLYSTAVPIGQLPSSARALTINSSTTLRVASWLPVIDADVT